MIGLDTNVLVRYIMQDDVKQSPKATQIIEALDGVGSGYITLVSIFELVLVLSTSYELTRAQLAQALDGIMRTKQFKIESADQVIRALRVFKAGKSDFADCLIERSADSAGCERTVTFDVSASKHAGMTLII
ncbi:MAG: type II toxin-antitoxin system VapC family toxin [Polaromonas sp.]|nr:type II toxin-antitoxin system VapC family toxin [Polaromonas sp.]